MRLAPSVLAAAIFIALASTAPATAATFGFDCITSNHASDCATGEAQLRVEVTDAGSGKVDFKFINLGPKPSSITDLYWDDDKLLATILSITNTPGLVKFSTGASPGNLPGGRNLDPDFVTSKGLLADSDSPVSKNGVGPNESVVVRMSLLSGNSFADVLADLANGSLRIGINVQGLGKEECGSESFVNEPKVIPEPASAGLLAVGLLALALRRRS